MFCGVRCVFICDLGSPYKKGPTITKGFDDMMREDFEQEADHSPKLHTKTLKNGTF